MKTKIFLYVSLIFISCSQCQVGDNKLLAVELVSVQIGSKSIPKDQIDPRITAFLKIKNLSNDTLVICLPNRCAFESRGNKNYLLAKNKLIMVNMVNYYCDSLIILPNACVYPTIREDIQDISVLLNNKNKFYRFFYDLDNNFSLLYNIKIIAPKKLSMIVTKGQADYKH